MKVPRSHWYFSESLQTKRHSALYSSSKWVDRIFSPSRH